MAATDDGQGLIQGLHDVLGFVGSGLNPVLGLGALGLDALLLGLQHLFGDGFLVVELDELLLLGLEGAQPAAVVLGLLTRHRQALLDLHADVAPHLLDLLGRQLDGAVEVLNRLLDSIDGHVPGTAAWAAGALVAEATEVLIDPAVALSGLARDRAGRPFAAAPAEAAGAIRRRQPARPR